MICYDFSMPENRKMTKKINIEKKTGRKKKFKNENLGKKELAATATIGYLTLGKTI